MKIQKKLTFHSNSSKNCCLYTLDITYQALNQIIYLLKKDIKNLGVKLDIKKSGCAGFRFILQPIKNVLSKQYVEFTLSNEKQIKIFVPIQNVSVINNTQIDFVKNGVNFNFYFHNPKTKNFCGCKESFELTS